MKTYYKNTLIAMIKYKAQLIALEVIRVLKARFENFPEDAQSNRNAPFHEAFLNAFKDRIEEYVDNIPYFISLASWLHGLNTTLGQLFFENVAHILSDGEKRDFKNCKYFEEQERIISEIMTDLKNGKEKPNLEREEELIFSITEGNLKQAPKFTADVFITEDDCIEAIELKTVRPNAGEMRGEKDKILKAKACLKHMYPDKEIRFFIGFPFDPLSETATGYDKERFMKHLVEFEKYFDPREVLLAGELWDRLSGEEKTMEKLLEIINTIATPNFMDEFEFINNPENYERNPERYKEILERWYMYDELRVVENYEYLKQRKPRLLLQQLFNNKGEYKISRIVKLLKELP